MYTKKLLDLCYATSSNSTKRFLINYHTLFGSYSKSVNDKLISLLKTDPIFSSFKNTIVLNYLIDIKLGELTPQPREAIKRNESTLGKALDKLNDDDFILSYKIRRSKLDQKHINALNEFINDKNYHLAITDIRVHGFALVLQFNNQSYPSEVVFKTHTANEMQEHVKNAVKLFNLVNKL